MAKGATVRASDSATRDCAACTETLKKIDPASAMATMASPADESPWTMARRTNGAPLDVGARVTGPGEPGKASGRGVLGGPSTAG